MSWFGGYKPKPSEAESREVRRQKLEADRLQRKQERELRQQRLQAAQIAQQELGEAIENLLSIEPDILSGDTVEVSNNEVDALLAKDSLDQEFPLPAAAGKMAVDFDAENGTDGEKAMDKMASVKCEFTKEDIEFWFTELETQLEVIEVKSQWSKRIALQRFLPADVKQEVKSLLIIPKAQAGDDIYKKIKTELLDLFGPKPEDAYIRAKNRVMTGKPSQLGKALINDICKCPTKLQSGCCAQIVWGMYREAIPVVIRNHIAELPFNKDTYKQIFAKSDQVYDSNKTSQPARSAAVAAVSNQVPSDPLDPEVAAVKPPRKNKKPFNAKPQQQQQQQQAASAKPADAATAGHKGPRHATAKGANDKLCRIHYRWGENGTYCAAPWKCPMKSIFKAPQ